MVNVSDSLSHPSDCWLALMIGNSRLHWAWFVGEDLRETWNTPHLNPGNPLGWVEQGETKHFQDLLRDVNVPPNRRKSIQNWQSQDAGINLWIASVVPAQSQLWQSFPHARFLQLDQVPLQGMYLTLGIDRALAVWGAIHSLGSPVLVIDAGTALTFTGADRNGDRTHQLVGGAILPGLRLQLRSLNQETAALPFVPMVAESVSPMPNSPKANSPQLPTRWALNTPEAIASGVVYTLIASIQSFIQDWWQRFPNSAIVMTGGDSDLLHQCLQQAYPEMANQIAIDSQVIFRGMQAMISSSTAPDRS
jgi:type III pantothenate kinase